MQTGIRTLVGFWEDLTSPRGSTTGGKRWKRAAGGNGRPTGVVKLDVSADAKVAPRELLRPYRTVGLVVDAATCPPSYEECAQDVPPDYTVSVFPRVTAVKVTDCSFEPVRRGREARTNAWLYQRLPMLSRA